MIFISMMVQEKIALMMLLTVLMDSKPMLDKMDVRHFALLVPILMMELEIVSLIQLDV